MLDMQNNKEMTAICINDKTTRNNKIKILGLTEGKVYILIITNLKMI
jgi:hypothetical protein